MSSRVEVGKAIGIGDTVFAHLARNRFDVNQGICGKDGYSPSDFISVNPRVFLNLVVGDFGHVGFAVAPRGKQEIELQCVKLG